MKSSGFIWWIGAVILAALAGLVTYQTLSKAAPVDQGKEFVSQFVVVAATDIPIRRTITQNELQLKKFPVDAIPVGAATNMDQVVGKMPSEQILAGEPIMIPKLVTPDIVTRQLALSVPAGKVVMSVPIQSVLLGNRLLQPSDRVDIIGTFAVDTNATGGSGSQEVSIVTLENIEIHAIIVYEEIDPQKKQTNAAEEGGTFRTANETEQSILIAVDLQDALVLRHILDTGGRLDVVLRAPDDQSFAQTIPVNQRYLMDRYQILATP